MMITNITTGQTYFQDPNISARRGRNEYEANRRWRQVLENELIGNGLNSEQARAQIRSQRPWLYEETDQLIKAHKPLPTREENFIQAYADLGYSRPKAATRGMQRVRQDDEAMFVVEGCTDYRTAKETVWLLEAAQLLCAGDLGKDRAVKLIDMARASLSKK